MIDAVVCELSKVAPAVTICPSIGQTTGVPSSSLTIRKVAVLLCAYTTCGALVHDAHAASTTTATTPLERTPLCMPLPSRCAGRTVNHAPRRVITVRARTPD